MLTVYMMRRLIKLSVLRPCVSVQMNELLRTTTMTVRTS